MVDPFTAVTVILATVCGIVQAVKALQDLYEDHRLRKAQRLHDQGMDDREGLPASTLDLLERFNTLSSNFGRDLGNHLDGQVKKDVDALVPRVRALLVELDRLKQGATGPEARHKGDKSIELAQKDLGSRAELLRREIERLLASFMSRHGCESELDREPEPVSGAPLKLCYGAILCQLGRANAQELAVPRDPNSGQRWGFTCKYCSLEVGDYSAIRLSRHGQPVVHAEMLAASHASACRSLADRRAFYKCIPCYRNHIDIGFASATDFERHSRRHPGQEFIVNEEQALESTREKIKYYILEPANAVRVEPVDEDHGTPTVSPLTSPPLTPKVRPGQPATAPPVPEDASQSAVPPRPSVPPPPTPSLPRHEAAARPQEMPAKPEHVVFEMPASPEPPLQAGRGANIYELGAQAPALRPSATMEEQQPRTRTAEVLGGGLGRNNPVNSGSGDLRASRPLTPTGTPPRQHPLVPQVPQRKPVRGHAEQRY